ncbi:hypothetical protein LZL87_013694 [Fusarium oxysporum]|nr:hypothetical protein LZL87_013694 [Fusarium oxysporum]
MQRLEERLNDSKDPRRCILPFPDPTMAGEQSKDQSFYDLLVEDPEVPSVKTDDSAITTRSFLTSAAHFIAESNQPRYAAAARPDRDGDPPAAASPCPGRPNLNPTLFNVIVPGTMIPAPDNTSRHHSHLPQAPIDADFAYSSEFVTLSSIQSCGHYDSGFSGHWDGTLNHGTSTPRVAIPIEQVTNNPRAELDVALQDNSPTPALQPKRTPRTRRKKKEAHNISEASQGSNSSADAGAPSLSDVASPSPALYNSYIKERRAQASHNRIEKHYRNRLNAQFESLLNALPAKVRQGDTSNGDDNEWDGTSDLDRRVSKGEVLEIACKHIQGLERESNELQRENFELKGSLQRLKGSASDSTVSSSEPEAPFNFN